MPSKCQIVATFERVRTAPAISMALQNSAKIDRRHKIAIPIAREGMACIGLVGAFSSHAPSWYPSALAGGSSAS